MSGRIVGALSCFEAIYAKPLLLLGLLDGESIYGDVGRRKPPWHCCLDGCRGCISDETLNTFKSPSDQ